MRKLHPFRRREACATSRHNRLVTSAHPRITIEPNKRDGKPCIRGMRITVNEVLGWLSHGMTEDEILDEHPGLEKEDFPAVYAFAAEMADMPKFLS